MIDTTTYENVWLNAQAYKRNRNLYWFIHMFDQVAGGLYFTNLPNCDLGLYTFANIEITPIVQTANLFEGSSTFSPVHIRLGNVARPQAGITTKRFSETWVSTFFETEICTIYLGYSGILSEDELVPVYAGRMFNFNYDVLWIEFDVEDRRFYELPNLPITKFSRNSYPYIDDNYIDKPIPIVYGRWKHEGLTNKYKHISCIPGVIIQDHTTYDDNTIVIKWASHELSAINKILVYDGARRVFGEILDNGTISNNLSTAQTTINLYTYDVRNALDCYFYFYGNRHSVSTATNPQNAYDGDFSTYATNCGTLRINFPKSESYREDVLIPEFNDTTGLTTKNIEGAVIQLAGDKSAAFTSGKTVTIGLTNTTFSQTLTYSKVNSYFNGSASFTFTSDKLQLCYPYEWDGATPALIITEASDSSGSDAESFAIYPSEGIYPTMSELATELERVIDGSGLNNTYSVSYIPRLNKFRFKIISAGEKSWFVLDDTARSVDIGITTISSSYSQSYQESDSYTCLDIPDGDFSLAQVVLTVSSTETLSISGVRIRVHYKFQAFKYETLKELVINKPTVRGSTYERLKSMINYKYETILSLISVENYHSILGEIGSLKFFATVDGYPNNGSYYAKGPDIIYSLLKDQIGIDSDYINSDEISTASDNIDHECALYLHSEINAVDLLNDIARYSMGFFTIDHAGKYTVITRKSSYAEEDINFTVYLRHIMQPLKSNLKIYLSSFEEFIKELNLYYMYDWANRDYNKKINKSVTEARTVLSKEIYCAYLTDDTSAETLAEYFCGDGGTKGQFGEVKKMVDFSTPDPEFLFVELGDIIKFDSEFDSHIDAFGETLSDLYFMVVGLKKDLNNVELTLLEVG